MTAGENQKQQTVSHDEKCSTKRVEAEAAIAVCFDKEKKRVLLVKRRDMPVWVLPGGGIEREESPEQAALRELKEESGYFAIIERKVGLYTPLNRLTKRTHVFACQITGGGAEWTEESRSVKFFPIRTLPRPMAPPHLEWIQDALSEGPLIERPITCVTYWTLLRAFLLHPGITIRFLLGKCGIHLNS